MPILTQLAVPMTLTPPKYTLKNIMKNKDSPISQKKRYMFAKRMRKVRHQNLEIVPARNLPKKRRTESEK